MATSASEHLKTLTESQLNELFGLIHEAKTAALGTTTEPSTSEGAPAAVATAPKTLEEAVAAGIQDLVDECGFQWLDSDIKEDITPEEFKDMFLSDDINA